MQDFRDYYESLGVSQSVTADELKTAYRRAARRYHPDLNPGDETAEEKFKEIGEAYEILSDSDRRSEYDQFTQFLEDQKNPKKGLFNRAQKGAKDYSQFKDFSMFVDYLLNRRGTTNSPTSTPSSPVSSPSPTPAAASTPSSGSNPQSSTPASSTKAESSPTKASSTKASTSSKQAVPPSRATPSSASQTRPSSASTPSQNRSSASPSPRPSNSSANRSQPSTSSPRTNRASAPQSSNPPQRTKPLTEAQLTLPLNKAYKGGKERIRLADGRSLTVTLPPAMLSGQTVQVTAHEPSGDRLSLLIQVAPHDFFTLDMPDVQCTIPITPCEAILGGPISIPTLDGSVKMVVPAGARSGQKLRLPGKGYPFNGQRGDQIVELEIQMPTTVTARERELYEKIRLTESFRPRKNLYF